MQKEQLQLKIVELDDEVDKWHKERDRIKVSNAPMSFLFGRLMVAPDFPF